MSFAEKVDGLLSREQEPLSTADKVNRLLGLTDMNDLGIRAEEHGPFALVPYTDFNNEEAVYIVSDGEDTSQDRAQIDAQIDELRSDEKYKNIRFSTVSPRELLAILATRGLERSFHKKMGYAIMGFTGLKRGGGIFPSSPNFNKIDIVLRRARFENVG